MTEHLNRQLILAEHQEMTTERLLLRPVTLNDAAAMYEYASDEETTAYVFETHHSLSGTRGDIATYFLSQPLGKYGIELKGTNKLIGTIDIRLIEADHKAEIGYTLNKAFWGQGIMPEAAQKLTWLAFEQLNLQRLFAFHDRDNPASGHVMLKIGMKKEGCTPNSRFFKGRHVTDILYGMTYQDYQESQAK